MVCGVRAALILTGAVLLGGCATYAATSGRVVVTDGNSRVAVILTDTDRRLIQDYYQPKKGTGMPPGLAKREQLPPGLAKRDRLPPGLQGDPLPADLDRRLSPLTPDYVRIRIGSDIVLMERRTRVVVDIAYGLAR